MPTTATPTTATPAADRPAADRPGADRTSPPLRRDGGARRWGPPGWPLVAIVVFLLVASSCTARNRTDAEVRGVTSPALAADMSFVGHTETPAVMLDESFDTDAHGWDGPVQHVEDGDYVWRLAAGRSIHTARELDAMGSSLDDVSVDAAFTATGAGMVGIDCAGTGHYVGGEGYVLGLTPEGANITRAMPIGQPDQVLASTDLVRLDNHATLLTARCRLAPDGYHLALDVDHRSVLEATDPDPLGAGAPGLVVQAGTGAGGAHGDAARHPGFDGTTVRFTALEVWVPEDGPEL